MLQVFRIEHRENEKGPFQMDHPFTQELAARANANPRLPSPFADGLGLSDIPWTFVFGCHDLASLAEWFLSGPTPKDNENIVATLKSLGFALFEYLVEESDYRLSRSGMQVAFGAWYCREEGLVAELNFEELLKAASAELEPA